MSQVLYQITSLPTPFNMIVLVVLIGAISGIITTVVKQTGAYARQRQDLVFKRELIDRGMSADEVRRVIEARSPSTSLKPTKVHAKQYFASDA
jgi:hypothetical protein